MSGRAGADGTRMDSQLASWDEVKGGFHGGSLLLGNGSSRAVWEGFGYSSLYERASAGIDHPLTPEDGALFAALDTTNFESVLSAHERRSWSPIRSRVMSSLFGLATTASASP